MTGAAIIRFWVYLVFSAVGLITAWLFNGLAISQAANYAAAWFVNPVDLVLSWDLGIVALAVSVFIIAEAKRIGMKHAWLYIALSGISAMACTVPLFLAMRERHLGRKAIDATTTGTDSRS